jgi:replicative DNA helicase
MSLTPDKIPAALRDAPQWVLWKTIQRDKPTKVPYQVSGAEAKSNDPSTWSTFDAVWARYKQGGYDGPGYVFSKDDNFVGIDLDGCRNPEAGEVAPWARDAIRRTDSYSEVSPSKTGIKIFVLAESPFATGKKKELDEPRVAADKAPGIEIYSHGRYFAVTGWRLGGISPNVEERDLQWIREQFWGDADRPASPLPPASSSVVDRARRYMATLPDAVSGEGGHNRTFHVACVLVLGFGLGEDEAMGLLREYNVRCKPPWREDELQHKVKSADEQPGERNYLRDAEPASWKSIEVPDYSRGENRRAAVARRTTLGDAAAKYLSYLEQGKAQLLSLGLGDVDYALGGGVAPGEIVILAGRPSHGKSMVALQCVHSLTADGLPAVVISEEMSALAIGKRVIQFASETEEEHWRDRIGVVRGELERHFEKRAPCRLIESCSTAAKAAEEIRTAADEIDAKVAVVDYAQLLTTGAKSEYEDVTSTSKTLTGVARETGITLLMVCQLNRSVEHRPKFIPRLSDLRGAGQLEQDTDVILFVCWPWKLDSTKNRPDEYIIFVGKNRNRAVNVPAIKCEFKPGRQIVLPESGASRMRYPDKSTTEPWPEFSRFSGGDDDW